MTLYKKEFQYHKRKFRRQSKHAFTFVVLPYHVRQKLTHGEYSSLLDILFHIKHNSCHQLAHLEKDARELKK